MIYIYIVFFNEEMKISCAKKLFAFLIVSAMSLLYINIGSYITWRIYTCSYFEIGEGIYHNINCKHNINMEYYITVKLHIITNFRLTNYS